MKYRFILFFLFSGWMACQQIDGEQAGFSLDLPAHFPQPEIPEDNQLSADRVELGRKLFFDPFLSVDSSTSCASCHLPSRAFTDPSSVSRGVHRKLGTRNSPTLLNVAYHPYFFREGGSPTLEMQLLGPLQEPHEMGMKISDLSIRLRADKTYNRMAKKAYDREMSAFVITRALAAFERTLISGDSPFDQFIQGDSSSLSADAQAGWALFKSDRLACLNCHGGFDFTQYGIENNGYKSEYQDWGRFRVSQDSADIGKFKVPTLRNIVLTAPYMHDGSARTLKTVIEHYNQGGQGHRNQSEFIRPLNLSDLEKTQLMAFFESLSDPSVKDK